MITAICCAIAVTAAGAALRPRPPARHPLGASADAVGANPDGAADRERAPTQLGGAIRRRRRAVDPAGVAVWCEQLARAVRSGSTLPAAIRSTAPPAAIDVEVGRLRLALDRGVRLADAVAEPSGSPHLDLALAVIRACALNGGQAAEPLDRAASTLRGRAADLADRSVHSAQARLSAVVMTTLPIAMLALLYLTSAATRAAVHAPAGLAAVGVGGLLNLAGWCWMRRAIRGGLR